MFGLQILYAWKTKKFQGRNIFPGA
jgi:hypothetical protein